MALPARDCLANPRFYYGAQWVIGIAIPPCGEGGTLAQENPA